MGLWAVEDEGSGADLCSAAAGEADGPIELELSAGGDLSDAAGAPIKGRGNDVAAPKHMDAAGTDAERSGSSLGDDVLIGIADGQGIDETIAVEIDSGGGGGAREAVQKAGVAGGGG